MSFFQWAKSETWKYSLLEPDTGELCRVYGSIRSKIDWQEERWLNPYFGI